MGCGTVGGCNGGSGTGGKGRTSYTPEKTGANPWGNGGKKVSGGGSTKTVGKASEFGNPKVKLSFSSRTKK